MWSWASRFKTHTVPHKVQTPDAKLRKGVAVKSLADLIHKAKNTLDIKNIDKVVLAIDGTEVDEESYFKTLPPQTVFTILQEGEHWQPDHSQSLHNTINALCHSDSSQLKQQLLSQLQALLSQSEAPCSVSLLSTLTDHLKVTSHVESRAEDADWFEGLEQRFKTKDDVLRESCRRRIRSYYYTLLVQAKDYVKANARKDKVTAEMLSLLLEKYKAELAANDYYGHYFARGSENSKQAFCDEQGWFQCEGAFNEAQCDARHYINPYASRAQRIIFSTWNLDHRIEKSREVLPTLWNVVTSLQSNSRRTLNSAYFYNLLFTRENLRLVHITCHDKREHSELTCDPQLFYT